MMLHPFRRPLILALRLWLCALIALGAAACGAKKIKPWPQQLAVMGYRVEPPVEGIHGYSVEGFHSLDDRHMVIETGTATDYLITLAEDCPAQHAAETIGFSSINGDLSLSDEMIIHQISSNYKCPLEQINPVSRKQ
jgi:hypothetical protein